MKPICSARSLAEHLIAIPSVSPDPTAEMRCAGVLAEQLPRGLERGAWWTEDGRPVVWALLEGRSPRTVILLGHYDTVDVAEYAGVEGARGARVAYEPGTLRAILLEGMRAGAELPADLIRDLEEEARQPGTWLFGRGALDMKSGLAAGIAALEILAGPAPPAGNVLFLATPDEEHQSCGMLRAVRELPRFAAARGLELAGVLNLDYSEAPAAYRGLVGKLEVGCYVLGASGHVGARERGLDAIQAAAAIVSAVTRNSGLADRSGAVTTPRPAVLGLRDLKAGYSTQTPHEAIAEFSVMSLGRSATDTLERFRAVIAEALAGASTSEAPAAPVVLTYPELVARAGGMSETPTLTTVDARAATLARLRSLAARARLSRPAVVLHLLPPYYPSAAPRDGGLSRALGRALAGEPDVAVHDFYPFISDASYVSWRGDATSALARHLPSLGQEYFLPAAEAAALDLEVVNLGPWGRDAHGRFERVHAPYAFERLPGLLARVIRAAWEGA